jgi:lipoprotein-releasing system ATP-binding protein
MVNSHDHGKPEVESSMADPLISIRDLYKSFNSSGSRIDILKDINADLKVGETLAVVGPSGIGKSTLLHILGTLDRPDRGKILFKGEDVFEFDDAKLAIFRNKSIGFVFQFHHLLPEFTSLENAMMPALINGFSKSQSVRAAEKILVRVGLQDRLSHRVVKLSGGEQQRVALARALVLKPDILLADEPTGNLDKKNSEQVHDLLWELNHELGMTLVVVTHNMELANFMARRVTIIDGQLVETD